MRLEPQVGTHVLLSTASLSVLSYEDDLSRPVIKFWNVRKCWGCKDRLGVITPDVSMSDSFQYACKQSPPIRFRSHSSKSAGQAPVQNVLKLDSGVVLVHVAA